MRIINGKQTANQILKLLKKQITHQHLSAHLAVILVGQNPASRLYVTIKEKRAKEIGIKFTKYLLPANTPQNQIIALIQRLNHHKQISAILVQLPLPPRLDTDKIIAAISPNKDADGIHPQNLLRLAAQHNSRLLPATTGAIIEALKTTKIKLQRKNIVIIGKSKIVGLPTYYYLKNKCHHIAIYDKNTKNLIAKTKTADILIVAIGQPQFITSAYIKKQAIIIDVGINKIHGQTIGDVDFKAVKNKAAWITPVPGGIGPITVAHLLKNVLILTKTKLSKKT